MRPLAWAMAGWFGVDQGRTKLWKFHFRNVSKSLPWKSQMPCDWQVLAATIALYLSGSSIAKVSGQFRLVVPCVELAPCIQSSKFHGPL